MPHRAHPLGGFVLYRLCNLTRDLRALATREVLAPHQLDLRDWFVLAALAEAGPAPQSQIAHYTTLDKVAVNRAAARLRKRHLIAMRTDRDDGRQRVLTLTGQGREVQATTTVAIAAAERRLLARLGSGRAKQFADLLAGVEEATVEMERLLPTHDGDEDRAGPSFPAETGGHEKVLEET